MPMNPSDLPLSLASRIKVDPSGCWLWTGSMNCNGYGQFMGVREVSTTLAHRIVFWHFNGFLKEHLHHRHSCPKYCVNPEHLTPLTLDEHMSIHADETSRQAHCKNGHEMTPENTYVRKDTGHRQCRRCKADVMVRRYHTDPERFIRESLAYRAKRKLKESSND